MSPRAPGTCVHPDCDRPIPFGEQCPLHPRRTRRPDDRRPAANERGYDIKWRRISAAFIKANPVCIDCGEPSKVPDHSPVSRRELVARGEPHPDAWCWLEPRCISCHNRRTALTGM